MFLSKTNSITAFRSGDGFAKSCVVIFSFFGARALGGKTNGADFLLKAGYDVVCVESNCDDWHQGLPPEAIEQLAVFLRRHYQRVEGYGSSMGAYAAIAFAEVLGFACVLAISPQFNIEMDFDRRWASYAAKIVWRYRIHEGSTKAALYLVFDPLNPDSLHIPMIMAACPLARITLAPLRYSGHPSTFWLHRAGLLKNYVIDIFEKGSTDLDWRSARQNNTVHVRELGFFLFHRRRFHLASLVLEKAIQIGETGAQIHKILSGCQAQSGKLESGLKNAELAIGMAVSPLEKASCLVHLGHMLNHAGRKDDAIRRFDEAIMLAPSNPAYQKIRQQLKEMHAPRVA